MKVLNGENVRRARGSERKGEMDENIIWKTKVAGKRLSRKEYNNAEREKRERQREGGGRREERDTT